MSNIQELTTALKQAQTKLYNDYLNGLDRETLRERIAANEALSVELQAAINAGVPVVKFWYEMDNA